MYTFYYNFSQSTLNYLNPCCYVINCTSCTTSQAYVPIRLDIRPYVLPHTWDDPNELPNISGDRYFIKIYSPYLDNSITTPKDKPYNHIKIDKYGIYSNTALIGLLPSPSYNIKGCYKVEYWRWNKELTLPNTYLGCKVECGMIIPIKEVYPSCSLLKTEWWCIHNKVQTCRNINYKEVPMIRKDNDNIPTPNNTDYLPLEDAQNILLIDELLGVPTKYTNDWSLITEETKGPYYPHIKERVVTSLGIKWKEGPRAGTRYTLKYKLPLTIKDIIYKPTYKEQELININTY